MKILVIRFKQIGDVVLTSVLCQTLKASLPNAQVDFLVYDIAAPLFAEQGFVDNVIGIASHVRKSPILFFKQAWRVTRGHYDIVIDATSTARSGLFSWLSPRAEYRIGRARGKWLSPYTHLIAHTEGYKVNQRLEMLKPLIDDGYNLNICSKLLLTVSDNTKSAMRIELEQHGLDLSQPIFVFSVSSRLKHKQWRMDYQAEVAQQCIEKYGAQILLYAGAPHEQEDLLEFIRLVPSRDRIVHGVATPTLKELAALLSFATIFVGNECGPLHIAQALDIPTVAIFSPSSDMAEWAPSNHARFRSVDWHVALKGDEAANLGELRSIASLSPSDSAYQSLYDSITPQLVLTVIDEVISQPQLNRDSESSHSPIPINTETHNRSDEDRHGKSLH